MFHETFDYPVSHFKLTSNGTSIYVSYGRYEDNYYAIACYSFGVNKSEPAWLIGDLTANVVGLSLSKNNARLVAAFAQGYKQIWVIDPITGDILQDDLYYYDNSPSQDPALSANGDYLAYSDFSGMAYLYHWNGERFESVWTASVAGPGASSTWGCTNAISDDGSLIGFATWGPLDHSTPDFPSSSANKATYPLPNSPHLTPWNTSTSPPTDLLHRGWQGRPLP